MAPDLFLRLEKIAKKENIPKSALVESLIQEWAGEELKRPPTKAKPQASAPASKKGPRFIVNTDLFVQAGSEDEAIRAVTKLLKQEKIEGSALCADKDGELIPAKK